jgi:hypothetical protein
MPDGVSKNVFVGPKKVKNQAFRNEQSVYE